MLGSLAGGESHTPTSSLDSYLVLALWAAPGIVEPFLFLLRFLQTALKLSLGDRSTLSPVTENK